jgi:hypothetical protein
MKATYISRHQLVRVPHQINIQSWHKKRSRGGTQEIEKPASDLVQVAAAENEEAHAWYLAIA